MTMINFPTLAGMVSSLIFAAGTLPMLFRAVSTKNLYSYSRTSLVLANLGNVLHAFYIYSLPPGPIWLLHTFNLITTALMLVWHLRYTREGRDNMRISPDDNNPCGC